MKYDYLIVGCGLFGATFARLVKDKGKSCLIIDKRDHIGGNCYTKKYDNIDVHEYGPHIFHTNDFDIWNFVNRFTEFNNFILQPKTISNDKVYSLPFNMNTFCELWGNVSPKQVKDIIDSQKFLGIPTNLEEQALHLVGKEIYELLIKNYTTKQWKTEPKNLPPFIIKRLPVRFTFDNNYFDDKYQGIPKDGYTKMFENMLEGIEIELDCDYFDNLNHFNSIANNIVYTGSIDRFFDYEFGELEYRTLKFEKEVLDTENFQGCAVMNYNDLYYDHTRIIEHKHFTKAKNSKTIISKEMPDIWNKNKIPYYPINNEKNQDIYRKYKEKSKEVKNVIFGGRLSEYRYYDMHQVIGSAFKKFKINENIENENCVSS